MTFDLVRSLPILERTPSVLQLQLGALPDEWIHATEGPDTWSPYQVVAHLVVGEQTDWIGRAKIILEQGDDRRFVPFDRNAHLRERNQPPLSELLHRFAALRSANLEVLRSWSLTDARLDLTGVHPEFGVVTLRQLLATWVAHDLGHLVQVNRVMARRLSEAVGPWRAYLSVMALRA
jgi:hypothetical protein